MKYFYDHETDALSILIAEFADYAATEEVAPGVVMYVDRRKRPLAIDVRNASKILDTNGFMTMYERPISMEEILLRFSGNAAGKSLLRTLSLRTDVFPRVMV